MADERILIVEDDDSMAAALRDGSLTSVTLMKVLLAERGLRPEFKPLESYAVAGEKDFVLLIGDAALDRFVVVLGRGCRDAPSQHGPTGRPIGRGVRRVDSHGAVGGLKPRAQVLMAGVQVGRVATIQLAPDGKTVVITLRIYRQYQIHKDARFAIEQSGFLGDQYVAVLPTRNEGPPLAPGEEVVAEAVQVTEQGSGFSQLNRSDGQERGSGGGVRQSCPRRLVRRKQGPESMVLLRRAAGLIERGVIIVARDICPVPIVPIRSGGPSEIRPPMKHVQIE